VTNFQLDVSTCAWTGTAKAKLVDCLKDRKIRFRDEGSKGITAYADFSSLSLMAENYAAYIEIDHSGKVASFKFDHSWAGM
jgi:hypothetical protein